MSWVTGLCAVLAMTGGCPSGGGGDGGGGDTAAGNAAPVAAAGVDQSLDEGTLVQLDGSGSTDPNGDALTYRWSQTEGRAVSLSDPNAVNPIFVAPGGMSADERFRFTLVVSDGELSSIADAVTVTVRAALPSAADGFLPTMAASLAKGRFTLNNPWTRADLEFERIHCLASTDPSDPDVCNLPDPHPLAYESIPGAWQWVRPYTTTITEYEARRRQCEQDYNLLFPRTENYLGVYGFTDRKCYPTLQLANALEPLPLADQGAAQILQRYGYYCGGGHGARLPSPFHPAAPEPLDAVDYCCQLHDASTWRDPEDPSLEELVEDPSLVLEVETPFSNECGIAMCLRQATVKGIAALPPDVEEARQHWYGDGVAGGAAFVCPGNQSNDARAPVGE